MGYLRTKFKVTNISRNNVIFREEITRNPEIIRIFATGKRIKMVRRAAIQKPGDVGRYR